MFKSWVRSAVIAVVSLVILAVGIVLFTNGSGPQVTASNDGELWQDTSEPSLSVGDERWIVPQKYRTMSLNRDALQTLLKQAPLEEQVKAVNSQTVISLPMPDGKFGRFRFVDSPIMEPALAAEFPEIKTYLGQGIDDPMASVRFDITPLGFHSQVLSPNGAVYIDPYSKMNSDVYTVYYKRDHARLTDDWSCLTNGNFKRKLIEGDNLTPSGAQLRTYRTAVAATGEYTTFFGGTVAAGQAAIVTAMNRVSGIYELELAIRMVLVANNNLLVYTNAATDPYTNNDGIAMLGENQTNITTLIGNANYDIGHVFSTGGGGIAGLGVVGITGQKAQGVTGLSAPIGDVFYVDYVAHEVGHQFSGNHTFNTSSDPQRNASTAYEPGSGSTIMAYAGITGPNSDLQTNSDPFFHFISLQEILAHVDGVIPAVGTRTATGNLPPTVNAGPSTFVIPTGTAFELTATGADGNGDALTFSWEQRDLGAAQLLSTADNGLSPLFRVWNPTVTPTRTFQRLSNLVNNTVPLGEKLPTVARTQMKFRVMARDYRTGGGGIEWSDAFVQVVNTSSAFLVTAPNTAVTYAGNSTQTVTWNVAGTTSAPVSCATVNILLSTDGGLTFPTTVLAATPNDGTQSVTIPNLGTTTARIKVQCSTSVFFDMSNVNFTITVTTAANAAISGRIATAQGNGMSGAVLSLSDAAGNIRSVRTGSFGYYRFDELEAGQTYALTVRHKRYTFAQPTQVVTLNEDLAEANFVAE